MHMCRGGGVSGCGVNKTLLLILPWKVGGQLLQTILAVEQRVQPRHYALVGRPIQLHKCERRNHVNIVVCRGSMRMTVDMM